MEEDIFLPLPEKEVFGRRYVDIENYKNLNLAHQISPWKHDYDGVQYILDETIPLLQKNITEVRNGTNGFGDYASSITYIKWLSKRYQVDVENLTATINFLLYGIRSRRIPNVERIDKTIMKFRHLCKFIQAKIIFEARLIGRNVTDNPTPKNMW